MPLLPGRFLLSLIRLVERRVGVEFFPPRIRFGSGIVVGIGIPYARTGLGDAGALFVARMPGDAFQCLLADGVGERILFRGAGIEEIRRL